MRDLLRIASLLDNSGQFHLSDKLFRAAQRGIMNLDRLYPGAEKDITNWLKDQVVLLPNNPDEPPGNYFEFENVEIPEFLKKYVSGIDHNVPDGTLGSYNPTTKILSLPRRVPQKAYNNLLTIVLHEIRHSIDPRFRNEALLNKYFQQYNKPNAILKTINNILATYEKVPTYEDFITEFLKNLNLPTDDQSIRDYVKGGLPESQFIAAMNAKVQNRSLYFNNPLEHSSQMGDIARLLKKENLDKVREYLNTNETKEYRNLSDQKFRLLLKNFLNPKSAKFDTMSQILDYVTGNAASSLSTIVNSIDDPNWQKQYLKQLSDAVSVYNTDGNRFLGLVRKENRVQPGVKSNPKFNLEDNANAMKSRAAFFSKSAQLEALAESNPKAWSRFINFPMVSKMIPKNLSSIFKNIGTGSKSLSQSLRQMPPQSPLWGLLEPALEFGLYQFGLYLENPSAFSLETPEQKLIKDLNARINEIIANPKITDKRGYFIKNYGSYLKTLGSMEQNELLGKFHVMGFSNFMNIGRNIRQK